MMIVMKNVMIMVIMMIIGFWDVSDSETVDNLQPLHSNDNLVLVTTFNL